MEISTHRVASRPGGRPGRRGRGRRGRGRRGRGRRGRPPVNVLHVHPGRYHDSITLMWASAAATDVPGVEVAIVAMGTELNRALLAERGFDPGLAGADDLVVAVRAESEADVDVALSAIEDALERRHEGVGPGGAGDGEDEAPPRTVGAA